MHHCKSLLHSTHRDPVRGFRFPNMDARSKLVIFLLLASPLLLSVRGHHDDDDDDDHRGTPSTATSSAACPDTLALPTSTAFPFSTRNFSCNNVWTTQSFTLMYQNTGSGLWSFVLTAPPQSGYISIGFSPQGGMVGSDAIAGWIPVGGAGVVKKYYLAGKRQDSCQPDTGNLKVVANSTAIVSQSSRLYMGFQLATDMPEKKLVFAYGGTPGSDNLLQMHVQTASATVDYTNGGQSSASTPTGGSKASVSCASKLSLGSGVNFDTSGLSCVNAWGTYDFALFYKKSGANQWSFVLSAPDNDAYVSMGFSSGGQMVGSSAIAGWRTAAGTGVVKQYYLGGKRTDSCPPDQGSLPLVGAPVAILQSSRLFLAFQLNTSQPQSNLIYAIGSQGSIPDSSNMLSVHQDAISTYLDYATGQSTTSGSTDTLKTAHGLLGMLGWGVLVPVGVLAARYGKQWDPAWFYSHIGIQITGFVFGAVCIFTGLSLEDKLNVSVDTHKTLGIVIFVMGILQVLALLARPDKTSKIRKYWNWYHHNVGRVAIILAVGNIFYGISLAHEDSSWNLGFGIFLGVWLVATIVLEAWVRLRR